MTQKSSTNGGSQKSEFDACRERIAAMFQKALLYQAAISTMQEPLTWQDILKIQAQRSKDGEVRND